MAQTAQEALLPWLESAVDNARRRWLDDLTTLFLNVKDYFPDLVWEVEDGREIMGHAAMVYARTEAETLQSWRVLRPTLSYLISSNNPNSRRIRVPGIYAEVENEIRAVYTGRISTTATITENELQNLGNNLLDMWRSRLYSDVRIILPLPAQGNQTAIFYGHRFLLASRSKTLNDAIRRSHQGEDVKEPTTIALPNDIFTPASIHFILGYMCTGTLKFSLKEYDLTTALAIYKGAIYLLLPMLEQLVLAEVVVEMTHGLFHATLSDLEYSSMADSTGMVQTGCRCNSCTYRVPYILEFMLTTERRFKTNSLNVALEELCSGHSEKDATFGQMVTPEAVFPMLFAAEFALLKLQMGSEPWAESVETIITSARSIIENILSTKSYACLKWEKALDSMSTPSSARHEVSWIASAVFRFGRPQPIPGIYQASFLQAQGARSIVGVSKKYPPANADVAILLKNAKEKLRKAVDLAFLSQNSKRSYEPSTTVRDSEDVKGNRHSHQDSSLTAGFGNSIYPLNAEEFSEIDLFWADSLSDVHISTRLSNSLNLHNGNEASGSGVHPLEAKNRRTSSLVGNIHDSVYSIMSTIDTIRSLEESAQDSITISALDLATTSSDYSSASSRTLSTDYGVYARRMALSNSSSSVRASLTPSFSSN
ncbi:hypothetical protein CPB84DRAFT_1849111 [Gymnopilus junonius]|uniref:BTB domain-containing protein n=1 Tax=Gymnopilus junonius TaxID=109634 RepID=A0A9P5NGW0_GYMJU|nr:hypothetical protein CPB84DRAFT_1849111 [Gymnopilus junonius]